MGGSQDRQSVAEALRRSEQRYRSLVENLPGSVVILFDRDLRILLVDGPEVAAAGSSKEAMEGRTPAECLPAEFAHVVEANWRRVLAGERFSTEIPWEDRHYRYEYVPLHDAAGAIEYGLVVGQNITAQYRSQVALRESEARFRSLFEAAPDAFIIHDLEGRLIDGNHAAKVLFGLTRDEIRGQPLTEFVTFDPASLPAIAAAVAASIAGRPAGPIAVRCTCRGKTLDLELKTEPLQLDGRAAILVAARDIAERIRAVETQRHLEAQLHHAMKMESVGRLAGGIAHDFNNMLAAILAHVELVLVDLEVGDVRREGLEAAMGAGRRAAALVRQLLTFSRKSSMALSDVELDEAVRDATRLCQRLLGETVALVVEATAPGTKVRVDRGQLEQVLINLAVNARDAMPGGGELHVTTGLVEVTDAGPDTRPGTYAVVRVRDTGTGMSEETLAHVFEPFFTTKPTGQGTGLGLSTAYGSVSQWGGFFRVSSKLGEGSTFEVFLPVAPSRALDLPDAPAPSVPTGDAAVLVVDDDEEVLRAIERGLLRQGYAVHALLHVDDAITYARDPAHRIDLLITDLVMPVLDGVALYEKLAATRPGLRVLFVSGYAEPAVLVRANRTERARFLAKPFATDELMARIRDVLGYAPR